MKTISFLGIDGSGKTTLMRRLKEVAGERAAFLFAPDFHEIDGFARADESRALNELSRLADAYGDPGLKLSSLYLRMCLYGEAEAFLASTSRCASLCTERHPIVDSLTYLPVYAIAVKRSGARLEKSAEVMANIAREHPDVAVHVEAAVARRNSRLGLGCARIEQLAAYCIEFAAFGPEQFVKEVSRDFQTRLPDVVLYLEVSPEVAFERIRQRGKTLEAHESLDNLTRLDRLARSKLGELAGLGVACEILPAASLSGAELVSAVSRHFEDAR